MINSEKSVKSGYSVPYWWYDIRGFFIFKICYQDSIFSVLNFFARNFSKNHLEVAVGSASFMKVALLFRKVRRLGKASGTAFDYTPEMLAGAKNQLNKLDWKIEQADVTKLTYSSEKFETINVANAFHCFKDPLQSAKELLRVLKPEGSLAVNLLLYPKKKSFLNRQAHKVNEWGKKNNILESPVDANESRELFVSAGFVIEKDQVIKNNLRLVLKRPKK